MARNTNGNNIKPKLPFISPMVMIMSRVFPAHCTNQFLCGGNLVAIYSTRNSAVSPCPLGVAFAVGVNTFPMCLYSFLAALIASLSVFPRAIIPVFNLIRTSSFSPLRRLSIFTVSFSSEFFVFLRARFNTTALLTNRAVAVFPG